MVYGFVTFFRWCVMIISIQYSKRKILISIYCKINGLKYFGGFIVTDLLIVTRKIRELKGFRDYDNNFKYNRFFFNIF